MVFLKLDIHSRYVVGWLIDERESGELARYLIAESAGKQGITPGQLTLHADNDAPMTSNTLSQLLIDLSIDKSHSRLHLGPILARVLSGTQVIYEQS